MDTTLRLDSETKARFDNAQHWLSFKHQTNLTQTEAFSIILEFWEERNLKKVEA